MARQLTARLRRKRRKFEDGQISLGAYVAWLGWVRSNIASVPDSEGKAAVLDLIDRLRRICEDVK